MDAEDQHGDFLGKENRRLSKPFDKLVEVCEFKSNQPPDWTRAQKTTLAVDTQCQNANYISPHLVKSLDLSPEYLETPFELTGVGEETMSVDQKVQLIFRKARTYQNDDKRYQPVTFFVLKKDQEEFGLLLGTPDCLRMNVVGRAVLVLRPKQKKPVKDENREKDVDRHREESRKDKDAQKKKSKAKKKHGDNADRGDGDRTRNENRG
ncbi:hypothetical protein HYFRA_00010172 [Hymenoscyphus fraxineus]|uniref:Uncharacterized protein n=1 Tax=Hymenoscyphus fraxineus TaxID=746836 RepID=A0A9N9PSH9_9HELO|nr:hypothetical protein HYFRA_00010172 [Hymenoscyphus fraxineus]